MFWGLSGWLSMGGGEANLCKGFSCGIVGLGYSRWRDKGASGCWDSCGLR